MTKDQINKYKAQLSVLNKKVIEKNLQEAGYMNPDSKIWKLYARSTASGRYIYEAFTSEELLEILRLTAKQLGHSPAQKEVLWVVREYVRQRFGKWPYALTQAGLSKSAGKNGREYAEMEGEQRLYTECIEKIRQKADELGHPPHPHEMREQCEVLTKWFRTWAEVLDAAGVNRNWIGEHMVYHITGLEDEYRRKLSQVRDVSNSLGRAPMRQEIDSDTRAALIERCGTWRNALYQIGLEPVSRVSPFSTSYLLSVSKPANKLHKEILENSLYKVLNLDESDRKCLSIVKRKARQLKRTPIAQEIPKDVYLQLKKRCGSWRNILFQVGLSPLKGKDLSEIKHDRH